MDGVTILNTYQVYSFGWFVILVMEIVGASICFALFFALLEDNIIISGIFGVLCVALLIVCFRIPKTRTEHEIIIDNSVSWNELTKHYEILTVRGRILKVVEKGEQDDEEM